MTGEWRARVVGDSMIGAGPKSFPEGTRLIVDSSQGIECLRDGDYAVFRQRDSERDGCLFGRYNASGSLEFFNPGYPPRSISGLQFVGRIVESIKTVVLREPDRRH